MLSWQYPWLLLLLPLPWLLRHFVPAVQNTGLAIRIPFFQSISKATAGRSSRTTPTLKQLLAYTLWALLLVAATNPLWLGKPIQLDRSGRDLMMAIDLSQSMQLPDMTLNGNKANRLTALKSVANDFIKKRHGDRLGLILFGSKAYLQTPFTFDWQTVQYMLDDASIGLAGPRTAIGDAIGLSVKYLQDLPEKNRVLILLTDGANNSGQITPLDAAALAKDLNIKIYTIGLGSNSLAIEGFFGQQIVNPSEDLDEKVLTKIAKMTGGRYFRATDTQSLAEIYDAINKLEPMGHDNIILRPQTALYPIPLAIVFAFTVLLALRKCRMPRFSIRQFKEKAI